MPKPLILYVEDQTFLMQGVTKALEFHYEVITARNADIAWQKILSHPIDLVVFDIMMPEGQTIQDPNQGRTAGVTFAQKLRSEGYDVPLVCYTVLNDRKIHEKLEGLGATVILKTEPPSSLIGVINECLPKPSKPTFLVRLFNHLFSRRR